MASDLPPSRGGARALLRMLAEAWRHRPRLPRPTSADMAPAITVRWHVVKMDGGHAWRVRCGDVEYVGRTRTRSEAEMAATLAMRRVAGCAIQ